MMAWSGLRRCSLFLGTWLVVRLGFAQPGTLRVTTQEHGTGRRLEGVMLVVQDSTSAILMRSSSGPEGGYEFADLPPGKYSIISEHHGFELDRFTGIDVRSGMNTFVVVSLRRTGAGEPDGRKNVCKWRWSARDR